MYGARPLRRALQRFVENPLAKMLLSGELEGGDTVTVDLADGSLSFRKAERPLLWWRSSMLEWVPRNRRAIHKLARL